jgi:basic membrane protein A
MKKSLFFVMASLIILAIALGACAPAPAAKKVVKVCQVLDTGGIDDKSFNQMAWMGTQKAMKDLGVQGKYLESKQQSDYESNLEACRADGSDLIIAVGFLLGDATTKAAKANPNQKYAIVDSGSSKDTPNLLGNSTAMDQSDFLVGYLSAGMTKTGKLGTYVGILFPATQIFMDGYYLGMAQYNKVKGTNVSLIGFDPANPKGCKQVGNFSDQDAGKQIAQSYMDEGVDIILPVAGSVSIGSVAAMKERQQGCMIGVDQDWTVSNPAVADYIIASVVKRIDVFVFNAIKAVVDGTFKGGEDFVGTLKNGGTALAYGGPKCAGGIPAALKTEIDALIPKIISGELKTLP